MWKFFLGGIFGPLFAIWSISSHIGAQIGLNDSPDRFEQVLDQRYIPEVSEKIFTHDISMIRRQKMVIFGVLKVFIGNCTY